MTYKVITLDRMSSLTLIASEHGAKQRGVRQKQKEASSMLHGLLMGEPGTEREMDPLGLTCAYMRTVNLGSKKWPDTYRAVRRSGTIVRETEKMLYTDEGEAIRKERVICLITE